jgi:hypothetical protein
MQTGLHLCLTLIRNGSSRCIIIYDQWPSGYTSNGESSHIFYLEAKNIAVPNVVPYRYKLKLTEEISDLIRFRNQCRRRCGRNKNRELKKFVNKLTKDIRLRVFALRSRNWGGLLESCRGNQTKLF